MRSVEAWRTKGAFAVPEIGHSKLCEDGWVGRPPKSALPAKCDCAKCDISCAGESTSPSVLDDNIRPAPCRLPSWIWRVMCKAKTDAVLVTKVTTVSQRSFEKQFPFAGNVWKVREEPAFFFAVRPHHCSLPLRRECGTLESKKIIYRLSCLLTIDSSVLEFLQPYIDSHL